MNRGTILLLAVIATGCENVLGPDRQDRTPTPARLHMNVSFADPPGEVHIRAWLDLGVDALGRRRATPLDPLIVMGTPIATKAGIGPQLPYEAVLPLAGDLFASTPFTVQPPTLSGVSPGYQVTAWRTFGRTGPRSISVRRGEDIILPIIHPEQPSAPAPEEQVWYLTAESDGVQLVKFHGKGALPLELVLPGSYLARPNVSSLNAHLYTIVHRSDAALAEGDYLITPVVDTKLTWVIHLVD